MTKKRTTLKDIAEKLGISVATASRALRNHPEISQRIKDQVALLVETMHYRPNSFAIQLRKQRSGIIGVIIPKIVHFYSSTIIKGIISKAHEHNYQVLICESGNDENSEKEHAVSLLNMGIDGLLVSLSNENFSEDYFGEIQSEGFPIVFFDKVPNTISANKVLTNDFIGAFTATEHLIQNGYQKIAHFKGQKGARNTSPRLSGYLKALEKYQLVAEEDFIIECKKCTEEEGFATTLQLMQQPNLPDAIFCVNDELAIGALAALRKLNINVPNQVGVVGFSNSTAGEYMYPSLTTLAQSGTEIGQKATQILINSIQKDTELKLENKYVQYIIEPTIIVRESSQRTL